MILTSFKNNGDEAEDSVGYPCELVGGPHDGLIVLLQEAFFEVLQPRGKPGSAGESLTNILDHGNPFDTDAAYDRYEATKTIVEKDLVMKPLGIEDVDLGVQAIRLYRYMGVVSGTEINEDVTLL